MRFFTSSVLAIATLVASVMAAENPIIKPDGTSTIVAGEPFLITWTPTTPERVTLYLKQGDPNNLSDLGVIAGPMNNNLGQYEWTPSEDLPAGTNYAIMIVDQAGNINYTPLITIDSTVPPKASSSSAASSTTKSAASSTKAYSSTITGHSSSYHNSTTMATSMTSNITSTAIYGNSTRTSTRSSTSTPSESPEESAGPTASSLPSTGAAASLLKSPLALVVCLLGAVVYLN